MGVMSGFSNNTGFNRNYLDSKHVSESSISIDDDDVEVKVKVEEEELELVEEVIDMTLLEEDGEDESSSDNDSDNDDTDYDSDYLDEYSEEEEKNKMKRVEKSSEEDSEVEFIVEDEEEVKEKNKKKRVEKSSEEDSEVEFIEKDVASASKNTWSLGNGVIDLTGDDDDDDMKSLKARKGKGVKRKKAFGLDILDGLDYKKSDYLYLEPGSVAKRTRSNFDPTPLKKKAAFGIDKKLYPLSIDEEGQSDDEVQFYEPKTNSKTEKFGSCSKRESAKHSDPAPSKKKTVSRIGKVRCPLSVDAEASKPTLGVDYDTQSADRVKPKSFQMLEPGSKKEPVRTEKIEPGSKKEPAITEKIEPESKKEHVITEKIEPGSKKEHVRTEKIEPGSKKEFVKRPKRLRKPTTSTQRALKILADSLLDGGEKPLDDRSSKTKTEILTASEGVLQYKFFLGEEEELVPEKTDTEIVVKDLFDELDYALKCSEIGSAADPTMVEDDSNTATHDELDVHSLCRQGKHELKLDEEIGLVCKFCGHVETEIGYLVSPFGANARKRTDDRYRNREANSLFDELANQDLGYQSDSGSDCEYEDGTVWDLIPDLKQTMYPHQREGFEFLWKNIAGEICLEKLKDPSMKNAAGSGCIISHVPGTGKSRLTLVFLQSYMKLFPNCKPVIVGPKSMLLTWEEEFKKWKVHVPFHNLDSRELSGNENAPATNLLLGSKDRKFVRLVKLFSWKKQKSVLGIGYSLFERLAGEERKSQNDSGGDRCEKIKTLLLDTPNLFIFDEGHTPRNKKSLLFKALSKIKTEKRIILSGTPFQNNFEELFNTLCLVRPSFMDRMSSKNHGPAPNRRGPKYSEAKQKWTTLTDSIGKVSGPQFETGNIEELRATIAPFVHIHKGSILRQTLPGLRHSVVVLQPSVLQQRILDIVQGTKNAVEKDCLISLASVHPSLLPDSFNFSDRSKLEELRLKSEAGVKTRFLMELLRLSVSLKEKVLVFGQYLAALDCVQQQLKSQLGWTEGKEILYMDGKSEARKRQSCINLFNDPKSEAKIMLASTKACGEGINLVGASRVVLLDVVWNPSVERQAISRAYRIGQKKVVYVYRLITAGTMEKGKCCRQANKDRLSELVFCSPSEQPVGGNWNETTLTVWEDQILEGMVKSEKLKIMFKKIIYQQQPKESDFLDSFEPEETT